MKAFLHLASRFAMGYIGRGDACPNPIECQEFILVLPLPQDASAHNLPGTIHKFLHHHQSGLTLCLS
jgi:hypothetical protein